MRRVDIGGSNDRLRQLVDLTQAGETVLVVNQGKVLAELRPSRLDEVEWWNRLRATANKPPLTPFEEAGVREGWLTPATEFGPIPEDDGSDVGDGSSMKELEKAREDR